jgi:large subunit ribosomal protein L35
VPKIKTHRGAARRFRVTKTGKLVRRQSRLNHMLEKKTPARKRRLGREVEVTAGDRRGVRRMLGL